MACAFGVAGGDGCVDGKVFDPHRLGQVAAAFLVGTGDADRLLDVLRDEFVQ
ncbi:hypothetical protein D3C80_2150220 [compost metagenome]